MPKKSFQKKKAHREACRAQVRNGKTNQANGNFEAPGNNTMGKHMIAGYRVGQKKR